MTDVIEKRNSPEIQYFKEFDKLAENFSCRDSQLIYDDRTEAFQLRLFKSSIMFDTMYLSTLAEARAVLRALDGFETYAMHQTKYSKKPYEKVAELTEKTKESVEQKDDVSNQNK
jgi:hypothetical protein